GPELARAATAYGHCPPGEAVLTPGFRLPARFVIHAVGPVWQGGGHDEPTVLASREPEPDHAAGGRRRRGGGLLPGDGLHADRECAALRALRVPGGRRDLLGAPGR